MDGDSGRVLYEKDSRTRRLIASTTKLMTALVALESGRDLDEVVTAVPEWTGAEGSSIYLRPGEEITLEALLYGLLLRSGNDAALAVAGFCGGTVEDFVARMNEKAEDLGMAESGLDRLIRASYTLLGLISFLTSGEDECRAWTITRGTKAPQAAGKIHTDFERGFIRAETVAFEDLKSCGSMAAAREKGLIRSEGKEYVVQDGDIILFRFNV